MENGNGKTPQSAVDAMLAMAPDIVADLTRQFIAEKEFTKRTAIRARVKAVFDFISTDSGYPALPSNVVDMADYAQGNEFIGAPGFDMPVPGLGVIRENLAAGNNVLLQPRGAPRVDALHLAHQPAPRQDVLPLPGAQQQET